MSNNCTHGQKRAEKSEKRHIGVSGKQFENAAEFFKTLGEPTRIKMFWLLCHGEECVIGISEALGISSPAVSHHLRFLRDCGLVDSHREGKEVYYKIADNDISRMMHTVVEEIMEIACPVSEGGATSSETVRAVHDYLVEHLGERVTIDQLSKMFHINATSLKEAFKAEYGMSIAAHTKEHRMERALTLLRESPMSISEIAKSVGFDSPSRFSSAFAEKYGTRPSAYRRKRR